MSSVVSWMMSLSAAFFAAGFSASLARADELAAATYVRVDSDKTTVISPHARAQKHFGESTQVDVTYAVDIWTSASIDIRTSASVRPVTEQRDELDAALAHELGDLTLTGAYRLSIENDYTSHGGTLAASYALADNAASFDLGLSALTDTVGRSGDPDFARELTTLGARAAFTQVLDANMLAQLTYELAHNQGFQASPYRFVGLGGTGLGCVGAALCLPEHVPHERTRHAFALLLRRALSEDFSAGVTYRFYLDDWGLRSHTVLAELGLGLGEHTLLRASHRFYMQGSVDFYRARYAAGAPVTAFRTRDRELSRLSAQRSALQLEQGFVLSDDGAQLTATLGAAGNFYAYGDFVGLSQVSALELTAALVLSL